MFLMNQAAVIGFVFGFFFILIRDICITLSKREFSGKTDVFNVARFIVMGTIFAGIAVFLNLVYSWGGK